MKAIPTATHTSVMEDNSPGTTQFVNIEEDDTLMVNPMYKTTAVVNSNEKVSTSYPVYLPSDAEISGR